MDKIVVISTEEEVEEVLLNPDYPIFTETLGWVDDENELRKTADTFFYCVEVVEVVEHDLRIKTIARKIKELFKPQQTKIQVVPPVIEVTVAVTNDQFYIDLNSNEVVTGNFESDSWLQAKQIRQIVKEN